MKLDRGLFKKGAIITIGIVLLAFTWLAADTATKPLNIQLKTQITICQKNDAGQWEAIDEAGPAVLNFSGNLMDLATDQKVTSDFVWNTRTKKGNDYSVRLAGPANLKWNPTSGKIDGDLPFDITWKGKKARITGKVSTETVAGPLGTLQGKRASGLPGRGVSAVTLVSANQLQVPGEARLLLVCKEEYTLTPK